MSFQPNVLMKTCTPLNSHELQITTDNTDSAFMQFSSTCKRYTDVMALKNQLQCHVFNSQLTPHIASQLTQLIINLQTAALKLQNIEVSNFYKWSHTVIIDTPLHQYYFVFLYYFSRKVVAHVWISLLHNTIISTNQDLKKM